MTVSERKNAAEILAHTTALPFIYCRHSIFKCFFCNQQFTETESLIKHTTTHETPNSKTILTSLLPKGKRTVKVDISNLKCNLCDHKFTDLDEIKSHLVGEHGKVFTKSGNGLVAYCLKLTDGQVTCHICRKSFHTFNLLNRHMNLHYSNAICEICGSGFMTHQRLMQHKEIHLPGGYPCDICNKVYTTSSNLKYHKEKKHEGNSKMRMLKCPQCDERFAEHFRKLKHLKEAHGVSFTFECDSCKSIFDSRRALTMHNNKFHTKKTQCDVCNKSFSCRTSLRNHLASHSGENSYVCSFCQKSYRHQKSLRHHLKIHIRASCAQSDVAIASREESEKHVKADENYLHFD